MTDVFSLAQRVRNLGPEERLAHDTVADMLEHLGREIDLLRRGPVPPGKAVHVVRSGDWHAIYVEGELIHQDRSLVCNAVALRRLIAELGGRSEWTTVPASWITEHERFPDRLVDLRDAASPAPV